MPDKIPSFFDEEGGGACLCILVAYVAIALISYFIVLPSLDSLGIALYISIALIIFILMMVCIWWDSSKYCETCNRRIHPVFNAHHCELEEKNKESEINELISKLKNTHNKELKTVILNLSHLNIFKTKEEKVIFMSNMISLRMFEIVKDYKYTMIAMGSIIEFLLVRYCKNNSIAPEDYTDAMGNKTLAREKKFVNYAQSAIVNNLFGQKNSWNIVQTNLRNFRNYVHIRKEVKEEKIDEGWYITIKPVFERILSNFK